MNSRQPLIDIKNAVPCLHQSNRRKYQLVLMSSSGNSLTLLIDKWVLISLILGISIAMLSLNSLPLSVLSHKN